MDGLLESIRKKFGIGEYPPEYNPRVHGPYYPSRYYGKADTKFTQVKLGEMGQWLGRRNYDPLSMLRCIGRGWTRWQMKWLMPKKAGIAPVVQFCMGVSLFFYVNNYPRFRKLGHHHTKYHW